MGRRTAKAPQKIIVAAVFVRLHRMHLTPAVIAKLTGYSGTYVRQVLDAEGMRERWTEPTQVLASLPEDLQGQCSLLANCNIRD